MTDPAGPVPPPSSPPPGPPPSSSTPPGGSTPPGSPAPTRPLRRSTTDRMVSGVSGGLGQYFGVDPVIFRVLFAVLAFFGGTGLLLYLACWALIPEPNAPTSVLERGIDTLRQRRVPPWIVIAGAAIVLWIASFSWWAPGPAFPALALIALLLIVLVRRSDPNRPPAGSHAPYPWETGAQSATPSDPNAPERVNLTKSETLIDGIGTPSDRPTTTTQTEPLIAPMDSLRTSTREWFAEAAKARKERLARRRPIKIAVAAMLFGGLVVLALIDAISRIPFSVYLWYAVSVLGFGLIASLITRRYVVSLLVPIVLLVPSLVALGGTTASLRDGSGRIGRTPTSTAQLNNERRFAGDYVLDLTSLPTSSAATGAQTVSIRQAAGRVLIRLNADQNVRIDARVHIGDVQVGTSRAAGQYVAGFNSGLVVPALTTATGPAINVTITLTVGHVQIDRIG